MGRPPEFPRVAQRLNIQGEYASPLRSPQPCGATSLNILIVENWRGGYLLDFEVDLLARRDPQAMSKATNERLEHCEGLHQTVAAQPAVAPAAAGKPRGCWVR